MAGCHGRRPHADQRHYHRRGLQRHHRSSGGAPAWLRQWLDNELRPWFAGRILPVNEAISERWGVLEGDCQLKGIGFNAPDGLIAATALEHDLTLVTRNVRDFATLGVALLNPWDTP